MLFFDIPLLLARLRRPVAGIRLALSYVRLCRTGRGFRFESPILHHPSRDRQRRRQTRCRSFHVRSWPTRAAKGCTRPVNPPPSCGHFQSTIRAQRAQPEHNGPGTAGRFAARSGGLGRPTGRGAGCYRGDGEGDGERAIGDAKMECRTGAGLMAVRLAWASSFPPSIWQAHRVSATSVGAN